MKRIVFYSWQSDLPNSSNRGFIQDALEHAAVAITADDTVAIEPVVDRDTQGVPGSPDIASTIFAKISSADVFVADISITGRPKDGRPSPNPNVLIELGYAFKALGHERVILVFNRAFGKIEELPFDLRMRRVMVYDMHAETIERAQERKRLEKVLNSAVRSALEHTSNAAGSADTQPPKKQPNLKLHALRLPRIGFKDGVWSESHQYDQLAHTLLIRNEPKEDDEVKDVMVRAEMLLRKEAGTFVHSPLSWVETKNTAVQIGPAEVRELIVAVRDEHNRDQWDFVVSGIGAADSLWIYHYDFDFVIRLIDAENGRILPVTPQLCFRWEWPPHDQPGNPHIRVIKCEKEV